MDNNEVKGNEMNVWKIKSAAGVDLGIWYANTAEEALDLLAKDAGYESQADAVERGCPDFDGTIEECIQDSICNPRVDNCAGDGVCQADVHV